MAPNPFTSIQQYRRRDAEKTSLGYALAICYGAILGICVSAIPGVLGIKLW